MKYLPAITTGLAMLGWTLTSVAAAPANGGVDYEGNLALVPAKDPAPAGTVKLKPELMGVHPRLIFTDAEIAELKAQIPGNDIMEANYKAVIHNASRIKPDPSSPPAITTGDTSALVTAGAGYPNLVYAYGLEPDEAKKQQILDLLEMYLREPFWAHAKEVDSNMGAGNNMLAAGLLFDAVADELEPDFRKQMAEKLLTTARRMYYLGHQQKALDVIKYWQQDPANNHRWHRAAGMAACLLSIQDVEGVDSQWLLEQFKEEMDFLIKWFPHDGDCHEGTGYQVFGFHFLAIAATMMDRNLGTHYLDAPGFRNAWEMQVYSDVPGANTSLSWGDANNSAGKPGLFGSYSPSFFIGPKLSRNADAQAALEAWYYQAALTDKGLSAANYPWLMLLYFDPTLKPGAADKLPTYKLFADMGAAYIRNSWQEDAVLMMFKCGPYGGYRLNEYRNENDFHYVNVAHDDPDANSIALTKKGEIVIHPGVYFTNKVTANHNTVLVNGKGQINEGDSYTQPVPNTDMTTLSYLTGWKVGSEGRIIIEGEAGNAYPDLKQYRRSAIWMPGDYILMLDDVVANEDANISWQVFSDFANFTAPEKGLGFVQTKDGTKIDYQVFADQPFEGAIEYYQFNGRWGQLLMNRTQFAVQATAVKFATVFDPWDRGDLTATFVEKDGVCKITVTGNGINDTWEWKPSSDLQTPSEIIGQRNGASLITLTPSDKAPHGDA